MLLKILKFVGLICLWKSLIFAEEKSLSELIAHYCPEKNQQNYETLLSQAVKNIKKNDKVQEALKITLSTACLDNLPDWRVKILFLLSHFGLENGVHSIAVQETLSLYMHDSLGKEEYLRLARLYEKLSKTGLSQKEITEFLGKTKREKLRAIQLEGLALYYVHLRVEGHSETKAYEGFLAFVPQVKKMHHLPSIYKWVRSLILERNYPIIILDERFDESLWEEYYQKVRS